MACTLPTHQEVVCKFEGASLPAGEELEAWIKVEVSATASSEEVNTVSVTGGGAPGEKTLMRHINIGEETKFGVENYELLAEEEGGGPVTQAGIHPFQITNVVDLNTSVMSPSIVNQQPAGLVKQYVYQLPPGLIGNPAPVPQCTAAQFAGEEETPAGSHNKCEPQTAVGLANVTHDVPGSGGNLNAKTVPVFNLTPEPGEPARFGFEVSGARIYIDTSVRTGGDYGVTLTVNNLIEITGILASRVTFWGVPGEAVHDSARGWACVLGEACPTGSVHEPPPLLSMPTTCTGPMETTLQATSWAEPHPAAPLAAPLFLRQELGGLDGCNRLQFQPEISVAPDIPDGSTPTGLEVQVHVPQGSTLNPEGLAESTLKDTTVALPPGVAVNPGGADGLQACSEGEVGYLGKEPGEPAANLFTPTLGAAFCPNSSKIGTVEIETPLLPHALKGAVYLATQDENPFATLLAMYIVAEDPFSGVLVKLPGQVALDPSTGQLVSTFDDTPQLPFENLRLHFFGESRAPLGTPALCGSYTTQASFVPWSGTAPVPSSSSFDITSGPNGAPCQSPLPFDPSLTAGTTSIQAGGFSPFTMTMSREDGNQDLKGIALHMPPGLSGTLAGVALCPEAQGNAGTCGPASLIGETTVSVGLGSNPYTVTGGKVYLTGPYEGAPFGLSIVNPADAGPFHLGNVVVRAKIEVDPHTAQLTITSDTSGPYAIPQFIDGIPLQIKHINVTVNRPGGFTFNPTDCDATSITGMLTSVQGATSKLAVPFQATNCATLKFTPKFVVATSGKTSRPNGASLNVKLSYPSSPQGTQANISLVKVELPKQLPSRLTTLQKACAAAQFEANPAGCPAASVIGHARAITPILPVPLEGPAYFVSHGGEAFPSLIVVLQGYGVTVDLVGSTFISKAGITSSTFKTVPDVPVGTFELNLPEGPSSALAANGNLCNSSLTMPTEFKAQNGAEIRRSTPIEIEGCPSKLSISAHKVKGRKLTLSVLVPAAGQLEVSGKGLSAQAQTAKRREILSFAIHQQRAGKLHTHLVLRFTPTSGKDRKKEVKSLPLEFEQ
ncbi:MAG TPA: hypothetical protein VGL57_08450 [Solirubrobacteraceae bacterium]